MADVMQTLLEQHAVGLPNSSRDDWSVAMRWHDLLFAHWPIRPERLRSLIPAGLEIDTFDGWAWIGIVPFHMTGIRLRKMPELCSLAFPELNVRTYVRRRQRDGSEKSGVWFLSLDAASRFGVCVARNWYRLPYHLADIDFDSDNDGYRFRNRRRASPVNSGALELRYRPIGEACIAEIGTLEHWLVERHSLFAQCRSGRIACADIYHEPWQTQPAEAEIARNTMLAPLKISLPSDKPLLHFAKQVDAVAWTLQ
jgi:uncharacterized protein YqjF (DUF2071 family)